MNLRSVVLDSGVLIALFIPEDINHPEAVRGFDQLIRMRTRMQTPICVVLEVAKRLLFDVSPFAMRTATEAMLKTLEIIDTTAPMIEESLKFIETLDHRTMTLEDAIVINTALAMKAPFWTYNYRDFGSIKNLEFWTPA